MSTPKFANLHGIAHPLPRFRLAKMQPKPLDALIEEVMKREDAVGALSGLLATLIETNTKDGRVDVTAVANELYEQLERHQK